MKFKFAPKDDPRTIEGSYEKEASEMLKEIKFGDVVYDIGANIFDHTIYFAMNKKVQIYAFEPIPSIYEMGIKNMKDYNVENVIPFNIGLSDKPGFLEMAVENESSSMLQQNIESNDDVIKVEVETIDSMVASGKIKPPNFIKIDVEGFAENVFKGSIKTIEKYKPVIVLEPHPIFLSLGELKSKFKVLEELGYTVNGTIFNEGREYVLKPNKNGIVFSEMKNKDLVIGLINQYRNLYDNTHSKGLLKRIGADYKGLEYKSFKTLLVGSKFYRFFTFKGFKTK